MPANASAPDCAAPPEVADALDVRAGSPLIELVSRRLRSIGPRRRTSARAYRPDRYAFEMDWCVPADGNEVWSPVVRKDIATKKPGRPSFPVPEFE